MRRRAFTVVEMMVGLIFFSTVLYFCYTLMAMTGRRSAATTRKNDSLRAAMDISGRIRRNIKWASKVEAGSKGRKVKLTGADGSTRSFLFDKKSGELRLPSILDPTKQVSYRLARFREFKVFRQKNSSVFKYVISALPPEIKDSGPTKVDIKYSTTIAGEVCLSRELGVSQNPLWSGK